jgi:hypothetical protein
MKTYIISASAENEAEVIRDLTEEQASFLSEIFSALTNSGGTASALMEIREIQGQELARRIAAQKEKEDE